MGPRAAEVIPYAAWVTASAPTPSPTAWPIPRIVKRNTVLLAAAQACVGIGTQMIPTLGALIVVRLLGSAALAGLGTSMIGVSRFFVSYLMGAFSDRYGRKPGMAIGLAIGIVGAVTCGASMITWSFPMFVAGLLIFGMGMGAVQQLRVAAADMYPPARRAEGIGLLQTGSLVGAMGGPILVSLANAIGPSLDVDPIAVAWLLVPAVLIGALLLLVQVHPDPKAIAAHMEDYYPGYQPAARPAGVETAPGKTGIAIFVRDYPKLTAFVTTFAVQGNMSMMMAMTAYSLDHHGHALPMISLAVALHVIGMFGLSLPLGKLADRLGRRPLMTVGVLVAGAGSLLVVLTAEWIVITLGTVLVGIGWSSATIASTALIADRSSPAERGRAIGTADTFAAGAGIVLPLLGGPIAELFGLPTVGMFGALLMAVPLIMQMRLDAERSGAGQTN